MAFDDEKMYYKLRTKSVACKEISDFEFKDEEIQRKVKTSNTTSGKMLKKLIEKYNETCEE